MDHEAPTLAQLVDTSGFSMADLAFQSGLEKSTIARLWDDPRWLDRISGASLQALIRALPGIGEHVCRQALDVRRNALTDTLGDTGLTVDQGVFQQLVATRGVPEQYLSNALETAAKIMTGDVPSAAAHLMRFWGKAQDSVLGYLYDTDPGKGLIGDPAPLIAASTDMAQRLTTRTSSFHAIVAQATLTHHVAKTRGTLVGQPGPGQHQSAFAYRSGMVGMIIQTNDLDLSKQYQRAVKSTHLLGVVEDWAFPTYMRDAPVTRDFSLPRSLLLRHTAEEIMRELDSCNEAYVHYLTTVYLPRCLHRDPTFGLQLPRLVAGIRTWMEAATEPAVRQACLEFVELAEQVGPIGERTPTQW